MSLSPFRYISDGNVSSVEFLGQPLWDTENDEGIEPEAVEDYILSEAHKLLQAIRAFNLPAPEPNDPDQRHEYMSLYGWLGEDEKGSGVVGLKQALVPAGCIPMVATERDKMDDPDIRSQLQAQGVMYGKTIRLCRFVFAAELVRLKPSHEKESSHRQVAPGG